MPQLSGHTLLGVLLPRDTGFQVRNGPIGKLKRFGATTRNEIRHQSKRPTPFGTTQEVDAVIVAAVVVPKSRYQLISVIDAVCVRTE
jgi:hypothetical protein